MRDVLSKMDNFQEERRRGTEALNSPPMSYYSHSVCKFPVVVEFMSCLLVHGGGFN